ncbi:MAG: MFS transporter [Polyangiaceae bacterium]|jgi:proton-dependent oligopeptide transporter, POT family|nr:MFS transporter [Polyangiaceae bacterium]
MSMSTTPAAEAAKAGALEAGAKGSTGAAEARDDRMPAGIPFIVANEFAERFCYYGINAILTIYMTRFLRMGDADATTYHSLFKSGAYFFPLVGAVVSDVFWGKFRTIVTFSLAYALGCTILAFVPGTFGLMLGLGLVAFGTGGIKPCVSTNVGDQFTSKNQHLIERAFSYFYLAINAGSSISIFYCPVLLDKYGPKMAFGMPAAAMFLATGVFWLGRKKFAVVPPAGKAWLRDVTSKEGLRTIGSLAIIYFFVACFWALWDQSNGQTWTLQAQSSLMDKNLGFGLTILPAQIQVVNGLFILGMVPTFTFVIYPLMSKFFVVTPLRKIGIGLFLVAASFVIVSWIESRIQAGQTVSAWWQIGAYLVLSASEVLVSITALEFSYKQAPLRMKSFIMAMFLLSTSAGNLMTAAVNHEMVRPLRATAAQTGAETWVSVEGAENMVVGQKIDFAGESGLTIKKADGKQEALSGTFLVAETDAASHRVRLMDSVDRRPVVSVGTFDTSKAQVSTYKLVGPQYFNFFAIVMACVGGVFIVVAAFYKEKTHLREDSPAGA